MKKLWEKGKKIFADNKHKIQPAILFVGKCVNNVAALPETPRISSYINLGFQVKENYSTHFSQKKPNHFVSDEWDAFCCEELRPVVIQVVENNFKNNIIPIHDHPGNTRPDGFIVCLKDGVRIGWVGSTAQTAESMYVSAGKAAEVKEIIREASWGKMTSSCIAIDILKISWKSFFILNEQSDHDIYVKSKFTDKYSDLVKRYKDRKLGRSVLFYGPPGTGKSNIVRGIANSLGMRTLRLQNLNSIRNRAIVEILDLFAPQAIVLEDIDHLYGFDIAELLEKLEGFNKMGKYILGTANEVAKINPALLRPGRFDELIEISNIDRESVKEMIPDEDLFELVKDFPIAYIVEVKKRLETVGKEECLAGIEDIKKRVINSQKPEYKL